MTWGGCQCKIIVFVYQYESIKIWTTISNVGLLGRYKSDDKLRGEEGEYDEIRAYCRRKKKVRKLKRMNGCCKWESNEIYGLSSGGQTLGRCYCEKRPPNGGEKSKRRQWRMRCKKKKISKIALFGCMTIHNGFIYIAWTNELSMSIIWMNSFILSTCNPFCVSSPFFLFLSQFLVHHDGIISSTLQKVNVLLLWWRQYVHPNLS